MVLVVAFVYCSVVNAMLSPDTGDVALGLCSQDPNIRPFLDWGQQRKMLAAVKVGGVPRSYSCSCSGFFLSVLLLLLLL